MHDEAVDGSAALFLIAWPNFTVVRDPLLLDLSATYRGNLRRQLVMSKWTILSFAFRQFLSIFHKFLQISKEIDKLITSILENFVKF